MRGLILCNTPNPDFAAKFLLAVHRRVQRWLRSCQAATLSRTHVNDNVLDFDHLIDQVLNGSFHMVLPMSFKKIEAVLKPGDTTM
jgi:hypothetical protein